MTGYLNPLDILLDSQQPDRSPPDFRWGVVEAVGSEVQVRLDRDPTAVIGQCSSLYDPQVGDRVMVMIYDGRAVIFGRNGGLPPPVDPPLVWTDYTPTFTATTTNPSGGTFTRTGRYVQQGNLVHVEARVDLPETWSRGDGYYQIGLPKPAAGYTAPNKAVMYGEVVYGGAAYPMMATIEGDGSVTTRLQYLNSGAFTSLDYNSPATWTTGRIVFCGFYRTTS